MVKKLQNIRNRIEKIQESFNTFTKDLEEINRDGQHSH